MSEAQRPGQGSHEHGLSAPMPIDVRQQLAADRTLLALIRTAIALSGLGFVVARFNLYLREIHQESDTSWRRPSYSSGPPRSPPPRSADPRPLAASPGDGAPGRARRSAVCVQVAGGGGGLALSSRRRGRWCLPGHGSALTLVATVRMTADRSHPLDHLVVVVFENPSLDNVLGRLYGREHPAQLPGHQLSPRRRPKLSELTETGCGRMTPGGRA